MRLLCTYDVAGAFSAIFHSVCDDVVVFCGDVSEMRAVNMREVFREGSGFIAEMLRELFRERSWSFTVMFCGCLREYYAGQPFVIGAALQEKKAALRRIWRGVKWDIARDVSEKIP